MPFQPRTLPPPRIVRMPLAPSTVPNSGLLSMACPSSDAHTPSQPPGLSHGAPPLSHKETVSAEGPTRGHSLITFLRSPAVGQTYGACAAFEIDPSLLPR